MDNSTYSMVLETSEKLFAGCGGDGFDPALWSAAEEAGFPLALLREENGGFGFSAREAFAPVRVAAARAVALPLGETLLANWVLSQAGLGSLDGPLALAWAGVEAVPFGRHLRAVVRLSELDGGVGLSLIHTTADLWNPGTNHAGEARDSLIVQEPTAPQARIAMSPVALRALMSTLRTVQMAGAIEAVADMCLRYCNEREQFGRALGKFQVIQHQLAILATQSCAATVAADMALAAFEALMTQGEEVFVLTAAAAKLRTAEAATAAASIAHQVHGAIGFSEEYSLHLLTRRLWAWRDEDGSESQWAEYLANWAQNQPERGLWPALTACDLAKVA
ncbi:MULTISPECIES: acyl-CoA dehydrogenase family protein [Actibacterium]|uniref:Alkylation response protein AidB-like acyl-CoA dehydrogenase n=1 Tax=Actibacterium naphthalenivorans TaxID=1614693 RepID=A0A840CC34_9RHOB|nr:MULTISPECIES: acyl-CoA dehydrogenase family protein [Actibacterium]MBB4023601.1 alkylation response protein AidB-like acyl-CoA dehydrogenase [Actibacterium naphthalenivorans]